MDLFWSSGTMYMLYMRYCYTCGIVHVVHAMLCTCGIVCMLYMLVCVCGTMYVDCIVMVSSRVFILSYSLYIYVLCCTPDVSVCIILCCTLYVGV